MLEKVDCILLLSLIDFTKKESKHFLLQNLQKYRKIMDSMYHLIFETDLGKKFYRKVNFLCNRKKKKKPRETSAKLYSLS